MGGYFAEILEDMAVVGRSATGEEATLSLRKGDEFPIVKLHDDFALIKTGGPYWAKLPRARIRLKGLYIAS